MASLHGNILRGIDRTPRRCALLWRQRQSCRQSVHGRVNPTCRTVRIVWFSATRDRRAVPQPRTEFLALAWSRCRDVWSLTGSARRSLLLANRYRGSPSRQSVVKALKPWRQSEADPPEAHPAGCEPRHRTGLVPLRSAGVVRVSCRSRWHGYLLGWLPSP